MQLPEVVSQLRPAAQAELERQPQWAVEVPAPTQRRPAPQLVLAVQTHEPDEHVLLVEHCVELVHMLPVHSPEAVSQR